MLELSQTAVDEVTRRIVEALHPRMIYLYGSHAYGKPRHDSDVDLLVVVDTAQADAITLAARGYAALQGLKLPVELNVVGEDQFEQRRHWLTSLERIATEKGTCLYAA